MTKTREAAPHDIWFSANVYLAAFFFWLTIIVVMNTTPGDSLPNAGFFSQIPHIDKLVHFIQYSILMTILLKGINSAVSKLGSASYPTPLLYFPFIFAIIDELSQLPVAGRQTDILDILTDWTGAGIVLLLAKIKSG